jgi:hypothetical protein
VNSFQIELHLTLTAGAFGTLGRVVFVGWLSAINIPGFAQGRVFSLHRTGQEEVPTTHEADVSVTEIESIVDLLGKVGFPGSIPRVYVVPDTSDGWQQLNFDVTLNNCAETLRLRLNSSGFEGEDATVFQRLFS